MKLFLLTAAAVLATPALAQTGTTSGSMPQSGTSTPDSATPATPADQTPPPADSTTTPAPAAPMQAPAADDTMTAPTAPAQTTGDPVGGYQPSAPAISGAMQPGATVRFQQAPSPTEAFPAPAPLASYPRCRPGQFDKCMQGPGSTHSRQVRGRRSR